MIRTACVAVLLPLAACGGNYVVGVRPAAECVCSMPDATDGIGNHDVMHLVMRVRFGPVPVGPDDDDNE